MSKSVRTVGEQAGVVAGVRRRAEAGEAGARLVGVGTPGCRCGRCLPCAVVAEALRWEQDKAEFRRLVARDLAGRAPFEREAMATELLMARRRRRVAAERGKAALATL